MAGRLELEYLAEQVEHGEIDTVVAAFTDMQGRLIGKRVTGRFFLEAVHEEWHACNYLLTVDMEMEPVPGFKAASWEQGYGDFVGQARPRHAAPHPLAARHGAGPGRRRRPSRQRAAAQPARDAQAPAAPGSGGMGYTAKMASELEFYVFDDSYAAAREKDYRDLKTAGWYIEDYHILETTKREPLMRAIRNGMDAAGIPVQESKGEWGPGQEELNLVYAEALEMADRHVIYKNGVKEIAWLQGKAVSFMAKWRAGPRRQLLPHPRLAVGRRDRPAFSDGPRRDASCSASSWPACWRVGRRA